MSYLRDSDREALRLAHGFREEIRLWLAHRGVDAPLSVSPFVDPSGQPSVLVTMSADVARALSALLAEQRGQVAGRPDNADVGFPRQRSVADHGGFPATSDTSGFRTANDTGGIPAVSDTGSFRAVNDTGTFGLPPAAVRQAPQPTGTGPLPQPLGGAATGGFPQPTNGTAGFPLPDGGFRPTYPQAAQPPHR